MPDPLKARTQKRAGERKGRSIRHKGTRSNRLLLRRFRPRSREKNRGGREKGERTLSRWNRTPILYILLMESRWSTNSINDRITVLSRRRSLVSARAVLRSAFVASRRLTWKAVSARDISSQISSFFWIDNYARVPELPKILDCIYRSWDSWASKSLLDYLIYFNF